MAEINTIKPEYGIQARQTWQGQGWMKLYRDLILWHSVKGMGQHYIASEDLEAELSAAMSKYSARMDSERKNVAQTVDQGAVSNA